jgi:trehalose synthase
LDRFRDVLGGEAVARFTEEMTTARDQLAERTVWHINSTSEGGGVAEMLQCVLGYPMDCGIRVRWLVVDGNDEFFELTKRLHHLLHGSSGDGGQIGPREQRQYESFLAAEALELEPLVRAGDAVVLHDPQTLGLAPPLAEIGATVIWSCHIGADVPNDHSRAAWRFLLPYTRATSHQVFSRGQYRWEGLDPDTVAIIPPCIDVHSVKNQPLDDAQVTAILAASGVLPDPLPTPPPSYARQDGTRGQIGAVAEMIEDAAVPPDAPLVVQISRWDPLKDHVGVLTGFCEHVAGDLDAHLILAGPAADAVSDDPESEQTLAELRDAWSRIEAERRRNVHIGCLPMSDVDENAAIVNALQRRADVVVQKSLAEGFGLTVAEAMWKARPTVGSRVGGIQDQIEDDTSGALVEPDDLAAFGAAVTALLRDRAAAARFGRAARQRVCDNYLAPRYLVDMFQLVTSAIRR